MVYGLTLMCRVGGLQFFSSIELVLTAMISQFCPVQCLTKKFMSIEIFHIFTHNNYQFYCTSITFLILSQNSGEEECIETLFVAITAVNLWIISKRFGHLETKFQCDSIKILPLAYLSKVMGKADAILQASLSERCGKHWKGCQSIRELEKNLFTNITLWNYAILAHIYIYVNHSIVPVAIYLRIIQQHNDLLGH